MTDVSQPSTRQRKVDSFLRAANIGTVAVVVSPLTLLWFDSYFTGYEKGDPLLAPAVFLVVMLVCILSETYAVFAMFFKRDVDEFTQAIWQSGTTWAFFAAIVWLLLGIWVEALFLGAEGFSSLEAHEAAQAQGLDVGEFEPPKQEDSFIDRFAVHVILMAFFAGCQFKRIRGGF